MAQQIPEITAVPTNLKVLKILNQIIKRYNSLADIYTFKGSVETYNDLLAIQNPTVGDVYNVKQEDTEHGVAAGSNFVWDGTVWDNLGMSLDGLVRKINGFVPDDLGAVIFQYIKNIEDDDGTLTVTTRNGEEESTLTINTGKVKTVNGEEPDENGNITIDIPQPTITLDMVYPVGSIYLSTNATNPAVLFGGTWEAYAQGRVLIGAGTGTDSRSEKKTFAAGDTGGEYNHQLTVEEMPSHDHGNGGSHSHIGTTSSAGSHTHTIHCVNENGTSGGTSADGVSYYTKAYLPRTNTTTDTNGTHTHNVTISSSGSHTHAKNGSGEPHMNLQPYITAYIWRRVS